MKHFLTTSLLGTACLLLTVQNVFSQDEKNEEPLRVPCQKGNYITLEAGGGYQTLKYDLLQNGTQDGGFGWDFKMGFRHYFQPKWGVGLAFRLQNFNSSSDLNYIQYIENAVDAAGRYYQHRTYFNDYTEKQTVTMLEVPVEVFFQTNISNRWKLNLGAGLQGNIAAISNKFKYDGGSLETRAYYDYDDHPWNLELYGLDKYDLYSADGFSGNYDYKTTVSAIAEAGVLYALNYNLDLAFNINFNYGLIKVINNMSGMPLYDPDCKDETAYQTPVYNGLLNTQAKSAKPFSIGASIGIRYRFGKETQQSIDFDEARKARRHRATEDMEIVQDNQVDFDDLDKKHKKREQDSIELAENERRKRELEEMEFQRQQDSIANAKAQQDSIANAVVEQAPDTTAVIADVPEPPKQDTTPAKNYSEEELEQILTRLNDNSCNFNKDNPTNQAQQQADLDRLAEILKSNSDLRLDAYGHTCNIGSLESNKIVGMRRAESVKAALMQRGVPSEQIQCFTKWYSEPLVPNTTPENREKNRRYELKQEKK